MSEMIKQSNMSYINDKLEKSMSKNGTPMRTKDSPQKQFRESMYH